MHLEDYLFQIMDNNFRLQEVLGEYQWGLKTSTGILTFTSKAGKSIANCPVQFVGSESDGTWLWAWANEDSQIPSDYLTAVHQLKATQADSLFQDASEFPLPRANFGHEVALLCAGVSKGFGTFRCPYAGGAAYVVIESFPKARDLPFDPNRTIQAVLAAISTFDVRDHRAAWDAFPTGERLTATFDEQNRIKNLQVTLTPETLTPTKPSLLERLLGKRN